MSRPNSRLTRVRRRLVKLLDPWPPVHEAWCIGCAQNGGRTLVLGANAVYDHVALHTSCKEVVRVRVQTPAQEEA
ncbi:MAG TPA: hypothetical protein VGG75_14045 [Trebonia sp.]